MIQASIPLSRFTALDDAMMAVLVNPRPINADNNLLWSLCWDAMGKDWCEQFKTNTECAAMIVTMALLKQIEIVEDV